MLSEADVLRIAARLERRALVVVDEAYIEFSGVQSLIRHVQDLPQQTLVTGAKGEPDRRLAPAGDRARQQEVGEIAARNQQDAAGRTNEGEEHQPRLRRDLVTQAEEVRAGVFVLVWIPLPQLRRRQRQFGSRHLWRHISAQASPCGT